ncbi:hypothetical protein DCC85_21280 [Paenibacillus sp. CAA11]|uniref:GNAT family N-acetyltransferase n=1 Tax=Paenibacillus sp. CAA11 TaxID=1532905 RepID=UPI000D3B0A93|nr:GNAT family N-acetyltransferase [Paenibacillus sp. CAA11]AWB46451.1 hypothetical protein DCC85_21280 [Paenibacillus sp. CAA11]
MLERMKQGDEMLNSPSFVKDEARYNLLHTINASEQSLCVKSPDGQLIFAGSPGHNGWLWLAEELAECERGQRLQEMVEFLAASLLPGITGDSQIVMDFAERYTQRHHMTFHAQMVMAAYICPQVVPPVRPGGEIRQAEDKDVSRVAAFLAGFVENAFDRMVDAASQIPAAERMIGNGNLYLWMKGDEPVSMAQISHRSARHGRINAVYTPAEFRKNGFASMLVARLCTLLLGEGLLPLLYADLSNPTSNKVYQNIGFQPCGQIAELKFSSRS